MVRMRDLDVQKAPRTPSVYSVRQTQKPGDRKGREWMVRIDCFFKFSINKLKNKKEGRMNYRTQWLDNGPWMEGFFFHLHFHFPYIYNN
jgi:hypothetical protein